MYIKIINFYKNVLLIFIKILFITICLSFYINIISSINLFFYYIKSYEEFLKNENIFNFSKNNKLKIIKKYKKIKNPIISIISPVFNSEKYILRFLKSIQNQNFIEIEIILVDDYSTDDSIKIINNYKREDERIILIKNKKNKGTFINRNIGALYSKGKYIIFPDPDDIITNNIIQYCYKYATKYNIEMIRFTMYWGKGIKYNKGLIKRIRSKPINQPELSTYIFYGNNELQIIDYTITNKFIKKQVYIKALNSIQNIYLKLYITYMEDTLVNYILYKTAKNFIYLRKTGYFYIKNTESITNNLFKISRLILKIIFIFLKILNDFSNNSKYEKDTINLYFTHINKIFNLVKQLSILDFNNDFYFYYNVIKMYLNTSYLEKENKNIFENIKNIIKIKISKSKEKKTIKRI